MLRRILLSSLLAAASLPAVAAQQKFDIDPNGVPRNIGVLKSSHGGEFDSAASKAVAKWKYQPNVIDGEAVWARNQKVKLVFKQADSAK